MMGTSLRKQREVQQRELMFLDVARSILIEQGLHGLTLDELARATEYSKGTVHSHFRTKEDLVAALASQSTECRLELFGRAAGFQGLPRERMCAIGLADDLFARLHPHYYRSEMVVKMANLQERATPQRRESLFGPDRQCCQLLLEVINDGVAAGDLEFAPPTTAGDLCYAVVSLAIGSQTLAVNFQPLIQHMEVADPPSALRDSYHRLLDGFGWRPLTAQWDYAATYQRIAKEVFPDECQRAGLA